MCALCGEIFFISLLFTANLPLFLKQNCHPGRGQRRQLRFKSIVGSNNQWRRRSGGLKPNFRLFVLTEPELKPVRSGFLFCLI